MYFAVLMLNIPKLPRSTSIVQTLRRTCLRRCTRRKMLNRGLALQHHGSLTMLAIRSDPLRKSRRSINRLHRRPYVTRVICDTCRPVDTSDRARRLLRPHVNAKYDQVSCATGSVAPNLVVCISISEIRPWALTLTLANSMSAHYCSCERYHGQHSRHCSAISRQACLQHD